MVNITLASSQTIYFMDKVSITGAKTSTFLGNFKWDKKTGGDCMEGVSNIREDF